MNDAAQQSSGTLESGLLAAFIDELSSPCLLVSHEGTPERVNGAGRASGLNGTDSIQGKPTFPSFPCSSSP